MATAAKFVQPIPIFLAYLLPLDVDVVPIKFHKFLFLPTMFHERNKNKFKIPLFISMATAAKFVLSILIFLAYLVPQDVDVTRHITGKICEVWSECKNVCTLVIMATAAILNFFNPKKVPHTMVDIPSKFHEA
jgi:hypothetical protein